MLAVFVVLSVLAAATLVVLVNVPSAPASAELRVPPDVFAEATRRMAVPSCRYPAIIIDGQMYILQTRHQGWVAVKLQPGKDSYMARVYRVVVK